MSEWIGRVFGSYRVVGELPRASGASDLFAAVHVVHGAPAAIQRVHSAFSEPRSAVAQWFQDARDAAATRHPGIVDIIEHGFHGDGTPFMTLDLARGDNVVAWLGRGPLPWPDAVDIAVQVARALDAAHQLGQLHLGLTPSCIFVVPDPALASGTRAKLLDFGARRLEPTKWRSLGMVYGTPLYLAPEQCLGQRADHRADIYSLGCVLFQMLCGHPPFTSSSFAEILHHHIGTPAPDLRAFAPTVPPDLAALIGPLLAKQPDDRPSLASVADELERIARNRNT